MKAALKAFGSRFAPPGEISGRRVAVPSLTGCADAFLAAALAEEGGPRVVLAVTPGMPDADRLADDLRAITDDTDVRVLDFPSPVDDDKSALGLRLKAVAALKAWAVRPYPCVVVASYAAVVAPVREGVAPLRLELGAAGFNDIKAALAKFGYERLAQVEKEGDCSVRGGIVDVWSPGEAGPVRAEFFGDELESLRRFDPATQVSVERIERCEILPVRDQEDAGAASGIVGLLPEAATLLAIEHNEYDGAPFAEIGGRSAVYTGDPPPQGVAGYGFQTSPLPGFAELGADEAHHPELFDAARKRLEQHVAAAERRGCLVVRADDLSGGFELGGEGGMIVVTKADRVFAKKTHRLRRAVAAAMRGERIGDFDDLEPGEYVVHVDYGVGKYIGSSEIVVDGRRSEVFTVEYADGGKLHVPAAHAHLLSRYVGVKGEAVKLHRLDGRRWEKDKKDAQKAVTDLAAALLETQAKRDTTPGFAYDVECDGRDAFYAAFPYDETPDQLSAIEAVEKDLASTKPMDRLICGDAGYGKTEVAMRAAFIAAMNGKQVAVLAPTTVLAEQHFETFASRFDGTPVRIESVSRFQTSGTHAGTFKRLETGVCDIVIGTHAILTPKVRFHDLGLIIIDEEQRFGVRHKEFLKGLRATADVLTLSATPIPRTLYLSMTGARDLSLLRSPPRERVAVETRVVRDSDDAVRTAVEAELARGGQVYFLHNRVMSIGKAEKRLKALCPKARIVVAHGQMDARDLAKRMRDFERGKYDVLLSTTIVESGIDIPRANTILVDRADSFGMADLYQLRGRVGRSSRRGYAYFLLPPSGDVDSDARERLAALRRHGGLGAGFNLAVRDLELRGAGNLLGSQQSGHIAAVGFGLYCQLLKRTIAMMKGERVKDAIDVKLNLDFAAPRLPFTYIEEDAQRLTLMKRFAEAQGEREVSSLAREMADRFGPPPPEASEYVRIALLRAVCAASGVTNIDVKGERAVFYTAGSRDVAFVETLRGGSAEAKLKELARAVRAHRRQ
ncbi:MAG: transcription-repair coupling factor [Kiritimatiellae bacterium]|nr:transcription-repair coupling factor [Kiritimatiellia bacterium]